MEFKKIISIYCKNQTKGTNTSKNAQFTNITISDIYIYIYIYTQRKPLIMITLEPALFDKNNRLITLSGGYKNLHYLTQFIVTTFYMYKKQ